MAYLLELYADKLAICRLEPQAPVPDLEKMDGFYALLQTPNEITLVCPEFAAPHGVPLEIGWRALEVQGPLEFSMVGVLSELAGCLSRVNVSIFVLSTYDTDIILVKERMLGIAIDALRDAGHQVIERPIHRMG